MRPSRDSSTARPWPTPCVFTTNELAELESKIRQCGRRGADHRAAGLCDAGLRRRVGEADAIRAGRAGAGRARRSRQRSPTLAGERDWFAADSRRQPCPSASRPARPSGSSRRALKRQLGDPFVANDCDLVADRRCRPGRHLAPDRDTEHGAASRLLLRQNALIAIPRPGRSFVPRAVGPYRRCRPPVFPGVGASDDSGRAGAPPSWSKWSRRRRSSTRRRAVAW